MTSTRVVAQLRRLPLLVWIGAVVLVLVGLTGAFGGFAPALDHGRPMAPGEEIMLHRWRVEVTDAVLVDDSYKGQDPDPRIRLTLRVEFVGDESACCLTDKMLTVRYAGASVDSPWAVYEDLRSSTSDFDPDVVTTRRLDFALTGLVLTGRPPTTAEVVVRDEQPDRSPIWRGWHASGAVASVQMPVVDVRRRR